MLVGHLSVGLIGKRVEPRISLGTWILAVLLADLIFFPLLIARVEHFHGAVGYIPYSHSLLMNAIWAALFAAGYFLLRGYPRGAWLLFAGVLSHWVLDVISHRPDMQLAPGVQTVWGLGLWNSVAATLIVEGGFWVLAVIVYARAAAPKAHAFHFAFWIGIALLTMIWHGNIRRGMDPDPVRAGVGGLILFSLVVAWGYWINRLRHRLPYGRGSVSGFQQVGDGV
jgi:hypothetical protein